MIGTLLKVAGYLFGGFIFSILAFNILDGTVYNEKNREVSPNVAGYNNTHDILGSDSRSGIGL